MADTPKRPRGRPIGTGKGRNPQLKISLDPAEYDRLRTRTPSAVRAWLAQMP